MRLSSTVIASAAVALILVGASVGWAQSNNVLLDDCSAVTVASHPAGAGVYGTWYDVTSDAYALDPVVVGGQIQIGDGGYTNGVYIIYQAVVPANGWYRVSCDMTVNEAVDWGIRDYQLGVTVNGVHRDVNPSDLAPTDVYASFKGLTTGNDNYLGKHEVVTPPFYAEAGDDILVAFSTDTQSGNWDLNAGGFSGSTVLVDNIALVPGVTVDPTDGAPDNILTFNSLMDAIHSFQIAGVTDVNAGVTTDATGVGVNNGIAGANVINVTNTAIIDEIVRIDSEKSASAGYTVQNEAITISGPGGGLLPPSAANNAIIACRDDGTVDDDGFEILTAVDVTIENLTFVPSAGNEPGDDLVTVDRSAVGGPDFVTFRNCVITSAADASNTPTVQSKSDALVNNRASIYTAAASMDKGLQFWPDLDEMINLELLDCVISHTPDGDGMLEGTGDTTTGIDYTIDLKNTIISYNGRYGIQLYGSGDDADVNGYQFTISGNAAGDGPVAGLGGPSMILGNVGTYGVISFYGPNPGMMTISETIVADNTTRQLSLDGDIQAVLSDVIIRGGIPMVYEMDNLAAIPTTWQRVTFDGPTSSLFGADNLQGPTATLTIRDSIFTTPTAIGVFGGADMYVDVDYCGIANATGGTANTIWGANIVYADPIYSSTDVLSANFLDVRSQQFGAKGTAGSNLSGGADYIGDLTSIDDWRLY